MKIGPVPETLMERLALALGRVPTPLGETLPTLLLARCLMVAARFGLFAALAGGPLPAGEVAARCRTHPRATRALLDTLASLGYVRFAEDRYGLTAAARRWLLPDSPRSLHDSLLFRYVEWDWIARLDHFVESGEVLDIHGAMSEGGWPLYQGGMAAVTRLSAPEVARRVRLPAGARDLLDLGGAHGLVAAAFCRRHPGLRAVVLDLPEAVEHAAPILDREGLGDRVVHRAGDVLAEDLGTESWDAVVLSDLAHHFDAEVNRSLARRIARALRPAGVFVIKEIARLDPPGEGGQIGALLGLYFALTSESGTWSFAEMAAWQRQAGLRPRRPFRLLTAPGMGVQTARKA